MDIPTYKVCILGGGECGKTSFVLSHVNGEFRKKYLPTLGVEVHPILFSTKSGTNNGMVRFNCWDCAGQERFGGLRDGYYIQAQACILFYTNEEETTKFLNDMKRVSPNAYVVLVKNLMSKELSMGTIQDFANKHSLNYYIIDTKHKMNLNEPFEDIIKNYLGLTTFITKSHLSMNTIDEDSQGVLW